MRILVFTWGLFLFTAFIQHLCRSTFPTLPQAPGNHESNLFFCAFVFEAQLTYNTMLVPGAQHSDLILLYVTK